MCATNDTLRSKQFEFGYLVSEIMVVVIARSDPSEKEAVNVGLAAFPAVVMKWM